MPILSKAADYYLTYRFIKTLATPFTQTTAYELGIIDDEGKILKKMRDLETAEEKKAYGYFERMVWNLKKVLAKIPLVRSTFGNIAVATVALLKENMKDIKEKTFLTYFYDDLCSHLNESQKEEITNLFTTEDAPTNSVGAQNIAGLEHDPDGPPVKKKKRKKKKRKRYKDFEIARR